MECEIYIGRNGCGKTSTLFEKFRKQQTQELNIENSTFEDISYKMFVPSVRVLNSESYNKYDRSIATEEEYRDTINTFKDDYTLEKHYLVWQTKVNYYIDIFLSTINLCDAERYDEIIIGFLDLFKCYRDRYDKFAVFLRNSNDGLKSFLTIMGVLEECNYITTLLKIKGTIYIDEIENHAYPKLIKCIIDEVNIKFCDKDVDIQYTTHSPLAVITHSIVDYTVYDLENEKEYKSYEYGRFATYNDMLGILFDFESPRSEDEKFFELVNKFMFKQLDEIDAQKFLILAQSKKTTDKEFYKKYEKVFEQIEQEVNRGV